jgi:hypothetical protein
MVCPSAKVADQFQRFAFAFDVIPFAALHQLANCLGPDVV